MINFLLRIIVKKAFQNDLEKFMSPEKSQYKVQKHELKKGELFKMIFKSSKA